ncbi:prepilin-type N-terminal cleavage/methylation domain-containing protein [Chitinimonas sp. BJB300]|uniref:prepilin-type N-terminal cleavage/methylation domain-containing protein n=1 Tax=Chitinimonas sp. BJB300 TaxID=1559339 RepID=UPI000C0CF3E9|nr:prepilin-type N-terminal cleavage/methylation domain-containing protein [Chitinimonas sp. BJB300]PHV10652.1 prepilin-type cleavage/methylation domain-containing protein [Chitinimonas sp. BJB300]TSJ90874.1 prepilin-type N-terminal cleavage/methylation domain-containing protein [Chitinimonas sp. BJB300]
MNHAKHNQQGFTLIEIAIVLVIIGLLLGGVLKGQEMIENGRTKNAVNDLNGMSAAVNTFRDRYHSLPGDENVNTATTRGWAANVGGGNNNGLIGAATANPFAVNGGENNNFWRSLRFAGLIQGDPALTGAAARPNNAFSGLIGITQTVYGITGNAVCMSAVPGKQAAAIDRQLDDGNPQTGTVRAASAAAAPLAPIAAAPGVAIYNETNGQLWTVCRQL